MWALCTPMFFLNVGIWTILFDGCSLVSTNIFFLLNKQSGVFDALNPQVSVDLLRFPKPKWDPVPKFET